jgi:hypothetical protein
MLIYGYGVENPCTISLYNLNTTYHFLGRRQTDRCVNYSKLAVQISSIIRRKNQQYALIVPSFIYFYVLAPTCFGSSLPSSGSLLDPPELLEKHN